MFTLNQKIKINDPYSEAFEQEAVVITTFFENGAKMVLARTDQGEESFFTNHVVKQFKCTTCNEEYYPDDYSPREEYISHCPKCNGIQCIVLD